MERCTGCGGYLPLEGAGGLRTCGFCGKVHTPPTSAAFVRPGVVISPAPPVVVPRRMIWAYVLLPMVVVIGTGAYGIISTRATVRDAEDKAAAAIARAEAAAQARQQAEAGPDEAQLARERMSSDIAAAGGADAFDPLAYLARLRPRVIALGVDFELTTIELELAGKQVALGKGVRYGFRSVDRPAAAGCLVDHRVLATGPVEPLATATGACTAPLVVAPRCSIAQLLKKGARGRLVYSRQASGDPDVPGPGEWRTSARAFADDCK
jgi:hypothetical protein